MRILTVEAGGSLGGLSLAIKWCSARLIGQVTVPSSPAVRRLLRLRWPGTIDGGDLLSCSHDMLLAMVRALPAVYDLTIINCEMGFSDPKGKLDSESYVEGQVKGFKRLIEAFVLESSVPFRWYVVAPECGNHWGVSAISSGLGVPGRAIELPWGVTRGWWCWCSQWPSVSRGFVQKGNGRRL